MKELVAIICILGIIALFGITFSYAILNPNESADILIPVLFLMVVLVAGTVWGLS